MNEKSEYDMYLVSDTDPEGSQWWVVHESAEAAIALIQKNWKKSGPFVAERADPNIEFGHTLSLAPDSNKDCPSFKTAEYVKRFMAGEVEGKKGEPGVAFAAGGGMMYRNNNAGESHQKFGYINNGEKIEDMAIEIKDFEGKKVLYTALADISGVKIIFPEKDEEGYNQSISIHDGYAYTAGTHIYVKSEDRHTFVLIHYHDHSDSNLQKFAIFGSIYAYRDGTRWKRMNQGGFKMLKRFIEDSTHLEQERILKVIKENEVDEVW